MLYKQFTISVITVGTENCINSFPIFSVPSTFSFPASMPSPPCSFLQSKKTPKRICPFSASYRSKKAFALRRLFCAERSKRGQPKSRCAMTSSFLLPSRLSVGFVIATNQLLARGLLPPVEIVLVSEEIYRYNSFFYPL